MAGPQYLYFQRMVRLRNSERVQRILGYDALVPDNSVHEVADFEYTVRSGPGWLHGGGTLDTDRLIIARRWVSAVRRKKRHRLRCRSFHQKSTEKLE
jgi:hypothetical protein